MGYTQTAFLTQASLQAQERPFSSSSFILLMRTAESAESAENAKENSNSCVRIAPTVC